jgi:hypothetical protein
MCGAVARLRVKPGANEKLQQLGVIPTPGTAG